VRTIRPTTRAGPEWRLKVVSDTIVNVQSGLGIGSFWDNNGTPLSSKGQVVR